MQNVAVYLYVSITRIALAWCSAAATRAAFGLRAGAQAAVGSASSDAGGSEYPSRYATDRQRDRVIAPDFLELASASWPATQVLGVVDLQ
jgi:hypothetical protein